MKKSIKNDVMRIRIAESDKVKYSQEAERYGMNLSEYVIHLLNHKGINIIEGGVEIANAIYELNKTLAKCMNYPNIPRATIEETIEKSIKKINMFMENKVGD